LKVIFFLNVISRSHNWWWSSAAESGHWTIIF